MFNFANMDFTDIYLLIIRIPIVLIALTVHEVSHGYAAYKLGDPTARNLGRLSLNPIKHLDPIGALCMLLFRFGWAKPVPVNTRYFKKPRRDMALTALAGPVSNLLMALVSYIISEYYFKFAMNDGFIDISQPQNRAIYLLFLFFTSFYSLNLCLGIFNLIPVPPLDGSRILFVFLPDRVYFGIMQYERYISLALIGALWLGVLDYPLNFLFDIFNNAFSFIAHLLPLI